jgi:hypothetical protein
VNTFRTPMKTSRLTLLAVGLLVSLFSLPSAGSAQTPVFPKALAGKYTGLLTHPAVTLGETLDGAFGRVDITVSSSGSVSGKLILIDKKSYSFTTKLVTVDGLSAAKEGVALAKTKAGLPLITINLGINSVGTLNLNGVSTLTTRAAGNFAIFPGYGYKVITYNTKSSLCDWKGVYSLTFSNATPAGANVPTGSAYASGSVSTSGTLKVAGRLPDGTSFTSSTGASPSPSYFMFATPYTLAGGSFASTLTLSKRTSDGSYFNGDNEPAWVRWTKMADATTVSFGPVSCVQTCIQWKAPGKGQTVRDMVGIAADKMFDIDFSGALDATTYAKYIPTKLGINSSGSLRVAEGMVGSPSPVSTSAWSKFFSGSVDPKTGVVKITIKVTDNLTTPPAKAKYLTRSVTFTGVMFQLTAEQLAANVSFVGGYTYTPPLPSLTGTYGSFAFNGPLFLDQLYKGSLAMKAAKRFTVSLEMLEPATPSPTVTLPSTSGPVTVSLAQDLKSVTFNGRKVSLLSGQLLIPGQIIAFSDVKSSPTNNLIVQIMFNFEGKPIGGAIQYYQVTRSGYIPTLRLRNYTFEEETVVLLP